MLPLECAGILGLFATTYFNTLEGLHFFCVANGHWTRGGLFLLRPSFVSVGFACNAAAAAAGEGVGGGAKAWGSAAGGGGGI